MFNKHNSKVPAVVPEVVTEKKDKMFLLSVEREPHDLPLFRCSL